MHPYAEIVHGLLLCCSQSDGPLPHLPLRKVPPRKRTWLCMAFVQHMISFKLPAANNDNYAWYTSESEKLALKLIKDSVDNLSERKKNQSFYIRNAELRHKISRLIAGHSYSFSHPLQNFVHDGATIIHVSHTPDVLHCISRNTRLPRNTRDTLLAELAHINRLFFPSDDVTLDYSKVTNTTEELAKSMYEADDFSAMPILADALQDADIDLGKYMEEMRSLHAPFYKGNWICDQLLGKE